jgi:hypothetical protein
LKLRIPVYSEKHIKPVDKKNADLLIDKAGGKYTYHWAVKV